MSSVVLYTFIHVKEVVLVLSCELKPLLRAKLKPLITFGASLLTNQRLFRCYEALTPEDMCGGIT